MAFVNSDDKRQETARVAFLDYLNEIENECKRLDELDDWTKKLDLAEEIVLDLPDMIENFSDVLSSTTRKELKKFYDFPNIYNKESAKASHRFIQQIQKTVEELGKKTNESVYPKQNVQQKSNLSFNFSPKMLIVVVAIIAISVGSVFFVNGNFEDVKTDIEKPPPIITPANQNNMDIDNEKGHEPIPKILIPDLISPENMSTTCTNSPTFRWDMPKNDRVDYYIVEIYDDRENIHKTLKTRHTSLTNVELSDGMYTWHVKANYNNGETSNSNKSVVIISEDNKSPSTPTLISPKNSEIIYDVTPEFTWNEAEDRCGIDKYRIEISNNGMLITRGETSQNHYTVNRVLEEGSYAWKVRAIDNAGNAGLFSKVHIFNIREN